MTRKFKITKMQNVSWGNSLVKAAFNLETPDGIVIRDCLLKEGQFGFFISSPSKKLKEPWTNSEGVTREYIDICYFPKEIREEINKLAEQTYDPEGVYIEANSVQDNPETILEADVGMPRG